MEAKQKPKPRARTNVGNGILRKPAIINNNSTAKNLNVGGGGGGGAKAGGVSAVPQGCTPLMYAAQQADHRLVEDLLKKEPSCVFKKDRTLKTALHYCYDNPTAVTADRILMAAPGLLEARDQDGFTPLHLAVIQGNLPLVTFLLANNADVMALDNERHSVVHWATVCGELEALRAVLSAGADASTADVHGGYPLHYAAQLCGAAGGARLALDVLRALLRVPAARVDAQDGDGRQPLLWAASAGSAPALLALVKAGAAVEAPDKDGLTALHCAASRGHTECIETLLTLCGARPDVIDSNGCTALHYAVTLGHAGATALLLEHGAEPDRQDRRGRSPAHCGCAKGQLETVQMLGARNANVWLRNAKGDLPLHEAVGSGRRELVKWLLEMRPSQVTATNNDGRTLLHIAANTDNTDLCKILLDFGAQIDAVLRTSKNILMTPLDCALHRGHRSTAKYLQMHGGLPASRLSSRRVLVNQDTIPRLPLRHIKSTKINLRDKIEIEKREVFEMSPRTTPKRAPSKVGNLSDSSDFSSDEYELQNKRLREERRRQKKQRLKREKMRSKRSSFSDGYDTDRKKRSSRDNGRAVSDSESSGRISKKKSKRSKSEPGSKDRSEKYEGETSKRHKHKKTVEKSSESDFDKKYKKRRKESTSRKSNKSSTESSEKDNKNEEQEKKAKKKDKKQVTVSKKEDNNDQKYAKEIEMLKEATEIVKNMGVAENGNDNKESLDNLFENRLSETETNTVSVTNTTMITEAQIHAESQISLEREPAEEDEDNAPDAPDVEDIKQSEESGKSVVSPKSEELNQPNEKENMTSENNNTGDDEEKKSPELKEHYAQILEERVDSEVIDNELELPARDGIIAIIPDLDSMDADDAEIDLDPSILGEGPETMENDERQTDDIGDNGEQPEGEFVQAIIGILPDDDIKPENNQDSLENDESPDSIMGEPVNVTIPTDSSPAVLKLIDEELSDGQPTDSMHFAHPLTQQDSEETTAGISEISLKSSSQKYENSAILNEENEMEEGQGDDFQDDQSEISRSKDKGVQRVLSTVKPSIGSQRAINKKKLHPDLQKGRFIEKDVKRKGKLYETQSYKVLAETAANEDMNDEQDDIQAIKEHVDSVIRDNEGNEFEEPDRFVKQAGYTRRRVNSISDNEIYNLIDASGTIRRRRLKKKYRDKGRNESMRSKSQNSDRDYESSGMMDSGFEPSPRAIHQNRIMSPRLVAYYEDRNATGLYSAKGDSKIPKRKPGDKNAVDMASVTQIVQTNMRRYFLERKIFQHLMDLKHIQIRSSKANEAVLVKRAIDEYHKSSLAYVGAGRYTSNDFTFKSFEKFLYESLRKLQRTGVKHLANLPERAFPDFAGRHDNVYRMDGLPDNPILCTSKTHRCYHAVHAYTGIPCSAYIPKLNHHTMPKPVSNVRRGPGFLPKINNKTKPANNSQVTLELCHGNEKQMISLPSEKLDKNKRYYVTFTVKGSNPNSDNENQKKKQPEDETPRNVKSV